MLPTLGIILPLTAFMPFIIPRLNLPTPAAPAAMSVVTCSHRVAAATGSPNADAATPTACIFHCSSSLDSSFIFPPALRALGNPVQASPLQRLTRNPTNCLENIDLSQNWDPLVLHDRSPL